MEGHDNNNSPPTESPPFDSSVDNSRRKVLQRGVASTRFERVQSSEEAKENGGDRSPDVSKQQQNGTPTTDSKKKKELVKLNSAVFRGDLKEVLEMISDGYDFSGEIDDKNQTVLHIGSYAGHIPLIEHFLKLGMPDINATDRHGWTALLCAASCGHVELCLLLLSKGANPKMFNDQNTTALHYLCRKYHGVNKEQKKKPQKDASKILKTLSDYDVSDPYFVLLKQLIDRGVDINTKNYLGETALMQACARGNVEAVQFLLDHKAKYKLANDKGQTALFYAETSGNEQILKLLNFRIEKDQKKSLITHKHVKLDNYTEIVSLMKDSESGVPLNDRKFLFITHHRCFSAAEMVDWILKNLAISNREDGVVYSQKLLDNGLIYSVNKKKKFRDGKDLFKFGTTGSDHAEQVPKIEKVGIEDFELLRVLGKGGFGKVVLAKKKDTDKLYAIKIMEKAKILTKPRDFKNLMSEKKILQNDCSFLVHLNYAFQTDTDFYLVMDFMSGGDLHYHWKQAKKFPEKVVQFIAAELILALSYLHSCGIIYRDLKPQNVLLDDNGHVCLADFGLSKEVTTTDTALHTACGTPTYSAPEVLDGSPYSKSVDYWSLGVVLYQLLLGRPPFEYNGDFAKLLHAIYSQKIQYPTELISESAILFLEGLLARDPEERLDDPDIIKRHPFFKGIDWDKLEVKKVTSPIKVNSKNELKYFDPKYTKMPVSEGEDKKQPREDIAGFSVVFEGI